MVSDHGSPMTLQIVVFSFSWVPAIFTRNYEIYVSNYCWIHNVSIVLPLPVATSSRISLDLSY